MDEPRTSEQMIADAKKALGLPPAAGAYLAPEPPVMVSDPAVEAPPPPETPPRPIVGTPPNPPRPAPIPLPEPPSRRASPPVSRRRPPGETVRPTTVQTARVIVRALAIGWLLLVLLGIATSLLRALG